MTNKGKAASLAATIKERLGIDAVLETGKIGQFDIFADGEAVATRGGNWLTRQFGVGYPDTEVVIDALAKRMADHV